MKTVFGVGTTCSSAIFVIAALTSTIHPSSAQRPLLDVPWDDLEDDLVAQNTLVDTNPNDFYAQCYPEFRDNPVPENRTMYNLIDKPSGLCTSQLFCGFVQCNPIPRNEAMNMPVSERIRILSEWNTDPPLFGVGSFLVPGQGNYNLPSKVLFPRRVGDIVAAVKFAKNYTLEISVKNSGHSFTGASTKENTLHINMNRYQPYAPTGVQECSTSTTGTVINTDNLSNQPCILAAARGKSGVFRVSGGENFDEAYNAVQIYNRLQSSYRFHLVGAAAGTVSPMGWTWQGGLAGTTGGRLYGFGADQVLMIEMVLPNGYHVRFGPTQWQADSSYLYPRTTTVSGVCHQNPEQVDESQWVWTKCPEDIDMMFDDLWFAVNGGGGGTFGIVTSVYLQLHDYQPFSTLRFGTAALEQCGLPLSNPNYVASRAMNSTHWNFIIDFYHRPETLGVSKEASARCSAPAQNPTLLLHSCYGQGARDVFVQAWKRYISGQAAALTSAGMSQTDINIAIDCIDTAVANAPDVPDFASFSFMGPDDPAPGKTRDFPPPSYTSVTENVANILVPTTFLESNKEVIVDLLSQEFPPASYWAFGESSSMAQDQSIGLTPGYRQAGVMLVMPLSYLDENFYTAVFPRMYDTTGTNFPPFIGSNHAGPNTRGPLTSDWTKPCPLEWTTAERDDKCISLQETIWGSEMLKRLESIKTTVDPDFMFDCYGCVGNSLPPEEKTAVDGAMFHHFHVGLLIGTLTAWLWNI